MIFRKDIASNQEIQFDKAKMLDNYQQYEDDLNFKLKSVKYYYFTDQIFDNIKSADSSPIKIESMCISNNNDLHKLIHNNILTKLMFRQDNKLSNYYKRRVLSQIQLINICCVLHL